MDPVIPEFCAKDVGIPRFGEERAQLQGKFGGAAAKTGKTTRRESRIQTWWIFHWNFPVNGQSPEAKPLAWSEWLQIGWKSSLKGLVGFFTPDINPVLTCNYIRYTVYTLCLYWYIMFIVVVGSSSENSHWRRNAFLKFPLEKNKQQDFRQFNWLFRCF